VGAGRGGVAPRFFFDRNLGKLVPEALAADGWLIEKHDDHFGPRTPDKELFGEVAARGWVFVTQDKKIRSRAAERRALVEYGLRTFSVASTANLGRGDKRRAEGGEAEARRDPREGQGAVRIQRPQGRIAPSVAR
jgi:hypothetical protein